MNILSTFSPAIAKASPRVLFSSPSSSPKVFAVSVRSSGSRRFACPCLFHYLKVRAMAEVAAAAAVADESSGGGVSALASSSGFDSVEREHSSTFLNARSEEELLYGIRKETEAGKLPPNVALGMEELYHNYKNAIFQSGNPKADTIVLKNMSAVLDRVFLDVEDPFIFSPYHKALRQPFDYYTFGQNYIQPLVDFRNSYVGNISIFNEMEENLQKGHNIVLISNHQTEADPAVIALLLEATNPRIAENITYVAGDRVLTDPLCKPFSMGRNLICVYSKRKKHE